MTLHIPFDNSYARLPDPFFTRIAPKPVAAPRLIAFNDALAKELGIAPGDPETLALARTPLRLLAVSLPLDVGGLVLMNALA